MLFNINFIKRLDISIKIINSSIVRTMSCLRCDVRSVESEDNLMIAFKYSFDSSFERFFKFKRSKNETLRQTFARISLNINNVLNKKTKKKGNKTEVKSDHKLIDIQLINDGINVSQELLNSGVWKSGQILRVGDNKFDVFLNAPTVKSIRLPKSIMSSFIVYPKVLLEFCSLNDCKYYWFRHPLTQNTKSDDIKNNKIGINSTNDSIEWIPISEGFYYNTCSDDIGTKLKVVCAPNNGIQSEAISENPIEANPGLCPFEERHLFCENESNLGSFRVMSYNILADTYADSEHSRKQLFPYCPPYALSIDYRKQLLIKEIIGYKSDICCLQEVDREVFESDLKPIMSSLQNENLSQNKYESIFSEKGSTGEGLSTFYKTSKFQLLSSEDISFAKVLQSNHIFAELLSDISANQKLYDRIMSRKSIFQCILLRSLEERDRTILLGNTHLYFHPDADHIRLIQSYIFVKYMENLLEKLSKERPDLKVSPLLCGDFNSCPEFGVLMLMTTGFVDKDIEDFKSNSDETIGGFDMSHSLSLESACNQPIYTNYTPFFSGCLDYIFYDTNNLTVSEVIPFPSHEQVIQNIALPSVVFPSDHLALICLLKWKNS